MNQIERLLSLRFPKFSNVNSSEHQLASSTSVADVKAKASSKTPAADVKQHYHSNQHQHRIHPLEQHYQHQQHLHPYLPYRSSAPVHHHHHHHYGSPVHSTNGHSPNASCIGGTAAASAAAAAAAAAAATGITSMHSPSRFSPITFHHCNNVPTAQVISAKMLLLNQQRSPPNRVYHLCQQQQQPQHQHIPEASPFLARCSTQSSVGHNHLHDSSNTSTFFSPSSSSSSSSGSGNDNFDSGSIFKSKLINFNCFSESVGNFITTSTSTEQFDDEDRENMAPGSVVALSGESNSLDALLLSTEDLSELSDDEDSNLHEFY